MAGSVAEERIRAKAEALLRRLFPDARIVHELVLKQGGVRIDLAAIRPGYLAVLEIKSERDVLSRLPDQISAAMEVADLFGVCVASKHADKVGPYYSEAPVKLPWGAEILVENDDGFDLPAYHPFHHEGGWRHRVEPRLVNPAARLEMLWAEELKQIAGSAKLSRQPAKRLICETMSGRQIREAVCATLRSRQFPRADMAIPFEAPALAA